ncbi:hypothetical protein C817_04271 [Dorea sp. 5-2]|nr:hypothetical protein C817_04271 [Dorea sp. 5-2]
MKLTRHNGRSGKNGTYNPRHNDRRFDLNNSSHIDSERARKNVYWDCYRGYTTAGSREDSSQPDFSFEQIERAYYTEHYSDYVEAQNARNEKTRHTERNRSVGDLLTNNKTCPEESIYQIGTVEESVPPETLFQIVNEFYGEFERRFGSHVHLLDWALHLDEGTPHIHERHVFDCKNRYGELCPQQEKALEELGIPLPSPDKWYYVKKKYKLKVNFSYNLPFFIQPIFPSYSISVHTHSRIHLVIDIHNDCGFLPYYKMSLCIQIPIYRHVHNFLF